MAYNQEEMKSMFLKELAKDEVGGNVQVACVRLGFVRKTVYDWRKGDTKFETEWDDIVLESKQRLADDAEHQLRKLVLQGHPTGIIFALKNLRPKDWKDRSEVESVEKRFKNHAEYVKYCESNGLDPRTGLRVNVGSPQVE